MVKVVASEGLVLRILQMIRRYALTVRSLVISGLIALIGKKKGRRREDFKRKASKIGSRRVSWHDGMRLTMNEGQIKTRERQTYLL